MQVSDAEARDLQRCASDLFRAGDTDAGIVAYQALLAARPNLPNSWFNLAVLQRRSRRFDDALASYNRALEHAIDEPEEVHLQRGVIYAEDLGQSEAARTELYAALTLNPNYVSALLNLGNLHEDCGERAEARRAYSRALQLEPDNALALARACGLAVLEEITDPLIARLQAVLDAPSSSLDDRTDVGFALGAAFDKLGAYDRAFASYTAANEIMRKATRRQYDARAQEMLVDRLIAAFSSPVRYRGAAATPVFICGMFRSGSTLIERILARHSGVTAGGELDVLPALIRSALPGYPESAKLINHTTITEMRAQYLTAVMGRSPSNSLLTDKRPDNFLHIGLIKAIFPGAHIIHTVRQPLDNILSVYFLHANPSLLYVNRLLDIAHYHRQQDRLMKHWRQLYPDIIEVDYDRLVANPQGTVADLLSAMGLPWEDAMLDHRVAGGAVRTASHWQVRQPLYRSSSGRWRHYAAHLDVLHNLLDEDNERESR